MLSNALPAAGRATFTSYWWWYASTRGGEALSARQSHTAISGSPLSHAIEGAFLFGVRGRGESEPTAQICITVIGRDADAIRQARDGRRGARRPGRAASRLDGPARPGRARWPAGAKPAIVTCRPLREGGMFDGPEEARLRILDARARARRRVHRRRVGRGRRAVDRARAAAGGVIVSRHDLPRHAGRRCRDPAAGLRASGGEVAKLAVTTERPADLLHAAARRAAATVVDPDRDGRAPGMATRVLAGAVRLAVDLCGQRRSRPGQVPAARLLQEFRFRRIRPDAAVYAVLGRPVAGVAVARDAQRRVRRARTERRLRAVRVARSRRAARVRATRSACAARA